MPGITDRFRRGKTIDHWELKYMREGNNTWEVPQAAEDTLNVDISDLDEPLDEDAIENTAESENWPPGQYKMQARYEDGTMGPTKWTVEKEGDGETAREPTTEEKMLQTQERLLEEMQDRRAIPTEEAIGAKIAEKVVEAADPQEIRGAIDFNDLLNHYLYSTPDPPGSIDEAAGDLYMLLKEKGDIDGARNLLGDWAAVQATSSDSLLDDDMAPEVDAEITSMRGLMTYQALQQPQIVKALFQNAGAGFRAGLEAGDDVGGTDELLQQACALFDNSGDEGEPEHTEEPAEDSTPDDRNGQFDDPEIDLVRAEQEVSSDSVETGETEGEPDDETVDSDADPTSANPDIGTDVGGSSIDEVQRELDEEADREAGEFPNAARAMDELTDAADDDAASKGGDST